MGKRHREAVKPTTRPDPTPPEPRPKKAKEIELTDWLETLTDKQVQAVFSATLSELSKREGIVFVGKKKPN